MWVLKNHHVRNIRAVALNRLLPPPPVCMPPPSSSTSTPEHIHRSRLSLFFTHDSFTSLVHDSCRRQYEDLCACPCLWHKNVERREDCTTTSVSNPLVYGPVLSPNCIGPTIVAMFCNPLTRRLLSIHPTDGEQDVTLTLLTTLDPYGDIPV